MAVKDFIHNQIKIAEIENKIDNVYSALTDLPNAIKMTINWWKVSMFDKGIGRCPKFQRRDNWGENLIINWFESLMGFFNLNPLVYVDVKSCLDYCITKGLKKDIEYYQSHHDNGSTYLTVEGGNRSDATYFFWLIFKLLRGRKLNIMIIKSVDRQTMHEIYIRMAYGNPPNRQEKRTGIYGFLSDKVRDISKKYINIFDRIKSVKFERMEEDELVAKTYGYTKYQNLGDKLDDKIDQDYRFKNPTNVLEWLSNMNLINKFFKYYNKLGTTKMWGKGFYFVVLFTLDWMRREVIKINDWKKFVSDFHQWFSVMMIDESIYYSKGKHNYSFADMVRHKENPDVRKMILDLCKIEIYTYISSGVCNEATSRVSKDFIDRIILYKYFGYKPKLRINGEVNNEWYLDGDMMGKEYRDKILTLNECLDSKICVIEHMLSLRKNKNADEMKNQEFADPRYNGWKSNKV